MNNKQDLIEEVVQNIIEQVNFGDTEAIEELLNCCPIKNLIAYLPENNWDKYKNLVNNE